MELVEVRGAPSYYACEIGILEKMQKLLYSSRIEKCLVVHGEKSWEAIKPYFPTLNECTFHFVKYNGECSLSEIERICSIAKEEYDAIIGIGGGKVLDLAKAVGNEAGIDVVLIPTLASTCAAWTPLSVIYNELGEFIHYTIFPRSTLYVFVEPRAILHSPLRYLTAGIADTLAKWYEADVIIRELAEVSVPISLAHHSAYLCKQVLLEEGVKAIEDHENMNLTPSLLKVIETNIVAGGMVGGFGDQYGRIAGAHSIHNGLTVDKETHHLLHGEKVAYGILVQLALEENWSEISNLLPFYKTLKLPATFADLGFKKENINEKLQAVAEAAVKTGESIHVLKGEITPDTVLNAFDKLENFVTKDVQIK